jgi:hypothetical protein
LKITVNSSEIPVDQRRVLAGQIADIVSQLQSKAGVDVTTLNELIIPDDFDAELIAFQETHDLLEIGRTNDGSGIAACKVVPFWESGKLVHTIFLDKQYWLGMLCSSEKEDYDMAVHYLHHELAHIQDGQHLRDLFSGYVCNSNTNDLTVLLSRIAKNTWGEYYANRTAGGTMPLEHACGISGMYETLDYVFSEVEANIDSYRYDRDIEALWNKGVELCWRLMYVIGSSLGYFHYHATFFAGESDIIYDVEKNAGESLGKLEPVWTLASQALLSLFDRYPNWTGVKDLDELSGAVLKAFNVMGLYPRQEGAGIYVDVPFDEDDEDDCAGDEA